MAGRQLVAEIRQGMDVYGLDGRHIGAVIALKAVDPAGGGADADRAPAERRGDAGIGDLGVPQWTAGSKGRGRETLTGMIASRGDFPTFHAASRPVDPNAAGLDTLRGHPPAEHGEPLLASGSPAISKGDDAAAGLPPALGDAVLLVQDPGTLGIAAQTLRVPLAIVRSVDPGHGVILALPGEEARLRYGHRGLEIDTNADVLPY